MVAAFPSSGTVPPSHTRLGEPSDLELVTRFRAGDGAAIDALVRRHTGLVMAVVGKLKVGPGIDTDDLKQVGFIGLVLAARGWNPADPSRARFSTYAFRAVRNRVLKELRRQTSAPVPVNPLADPDTEDGGDEPGRVRIDQLEARPESQSPPFDVAAVVSGLPPLQRGLVSAVYGLDGEPRGIWSVADDYGLSVPQAKHVIGLALDNLRGLVARPAA